MGGESTVVEREQVQLAQLEVQMEQMNKTLSAIQIDLKELFTRNDTITKLQVNLEHTVRNVETLWQKHDQIKKDNETGHEEFKQFINETRGAYKIFLVAITLVTTAMFGSIGWVLTELIEAKTINQVQQNTLDTLLKYSTP